MERKEVVAGRFDDWIRTMMFFISKFFFPHFNSSKLLPFRGVYCHTASYVAMVFLRDFCYSLLLRIFQWMEAFSRNFLKLNICHLSSFYPLKIVIIVHSWNLIQSNLNEILKITSRSRGKNIHFMKINRANFILFTSHDH